MLLDSVAKASCQKVADLEREVLHASHYPDVAPHCHLFQALKYHHHEKKSD